MSESQETFLDAFYEKCFLKPVVWFRETIVEPNRPKTYWYHRKYPRVPEIDECWENDYPCIYEAEEQFKRDMNIETEIVRILRRRYSDCVIKEFPDEAERCERVRAEYDQAALNHFIKYGDMGFKVTARDAYFKQKHRLVIERRRREEQERLATVQE